MTPVAGPGPDGACRADLPEWPPASECRWWALSYREKRLVPETSLRLGTVQLQVLFVVFVDALHVRIGFGEGDRFGEGVDVGVAGGEEPAVYGELGGVVCGQGGEDAVGVARQAFAEGEGAQQDAGPRLVEVSGVEVVFAQRAGGVVAGAGDELAQPARPRRAPRSPPGVAPSPAAHPRVPGRGRPPGVVGQRQGRRARRPNRRSTFAGHRPRAPGPSARSGPPRRAGLIGPPANRQRAARK